MSKVGVRRDTEVVPGAQPTPGGSEGYDWGRGEEVGKEAAQDWESDISSGGCETLRSPPPPNRVVVGRVWRQTPGLQGCGDSGE